MGLGLANPNPNPNPNPKPDQVSCWTRGGSSRRRVSMRTQTLRRVSWPSHTLTLTYTLISISHFHPASHLTCLIPIHLLPVTLTHTCRLTRHRHPGHLVPVVRCMIVSVIHVRAAAHCRSRKEGAQLAASDPGTSRPSLASRWFEVQVVGKALRSDLLIYIH